MHIPAGRLPRKNINRFFFLSLFFLLGFTRALPLSYGAVDVRETPVVKVVQKYAASVVNISTERIALLQQQPFWQGYGSSLDQLMTQFHGTGLVSAVKLKSIGSGVVIREDGLIVTNAHVVNMASKTYVIFQDGKTVEGRVVLMNQKDDLAFIQIDPPYVLSAIPLALADQVMTGETAIAIGNPFGFENSVSVGVVSGKNRSFAMPGSAHIFSELIQTDASINMGSSGGALLNLEGQLIGVNLAVVENAQNIAFAVSSKKIKEGLDYYAQHLPAASAPSSPAKSRRVPVT